MTTTQTFVDSFRLSLMERFSTNTFKLALYDYSASLSASTTAYTATDEASGTGYTAGGQVVSVKATYPKIVSNRCEVRFDDVEWTGSTITAGKALLYDATDSNAAVMVLDFGSNQSTTSQTFAVRLDETTQAIILI